MGDESVTMKVTRPMGKESVPLAAARRIEVLELRKAGHTFREIGVLLNLDHGQAHRDFKRAMAELRELELDSARDYRNLNEARLEALLKKVYPADDNPEDVNPTAISQSLAIINQLIKLRGLDRHSEMPEITAIAVLVEAGLLPERFRDAGRQGIASFKSLVLEAGGETIEVESDEP